MNPSYPGKEVRYVLPVNMSITKIGLCVVPEISNHIKFDDEGTTLIHDAFPSFEDLWESRDEYDILIIWSGMVRAEGSMQALKQYCLDACKILRYDDHICFEDHHHEGKPKLNFRVIVDVDKSTGESIDCDPECKIIDYFEPRTYTLTANFYSNLKSMAMNSAKLTHDDVPLKWEEEKLQSIYGNITYLPGSNCPIQ